MVRLILKIIILLVILAVPFLIGLLGHFNEQPGYGGIASMALALCFGAIVVLGAGAYATAHFVKKKGAKGVLIGFLIFLVLIPLVLSGTCFLSLGGLKLRSVFVK